MTWTEEHVEYGAEPSPEGIDGAGRVLAQHGALARRTDDLDANDNPIALKLTEGQAHDGRSAGDMLDGLGAAQILLADRAYDSDALRDNLAERGALFLQGRLPPC